MIARPDPGGAADPLTYHWLATGPAFSLAGASTAFRFTPIVEALAATGPNAQGQLAIDLTAQVADPGADGTFNYQWTATYLDTRVTPPATVIAASQSSPTPTFSFTETTSFAYSVALTVSSI